MMPDDLYKQVSPQDLADLITYLRQRLGPVSPGSVTLFDDDESVEVRFASKQRDDLTRRPRPSLIGRPP